MLRMFCKFALPFAIVLFANLLGAQCAPIANTGCPNTAAPTCSAAPRIGQRLTIDCPARSCAPAQTSFFAAGTPLRSPITIGAPLTCQGARCAVGCDPIFLLAPSTGIPVALPNDPALVGVDLCVQCGCLDLNRPPCLTITQATRVTIQR